MKYRLLAFLTATVLAFQLIAIGTASAENDSVDSRAVKLLTAMGIMSVDSDTNRFWDDTPVERAEIAEILCNMFALEAIPDATPRFSDVTKEDRPYVETVVRNGYMAGYSDTEFGPFDYVTREQLIKIFVTVLDADKMAEALGGFPTGYISVAKRIGLLSGAISGDLARNAARAEVADIIYSALHIDMPELVGISNDESVYDFTEGETFLTEMLDIYRYEGIVSENEATALSDTTGAGDGLVRIGDESCKDPNGLAEDFFGYSVEVYVRKADKTSQGEIIYIEEGRGNTVVTVDADDELNVNGFKISYYQGEKKRELSLNSLVYMIYNGKAVDYDEKYLSLKNGYVKFVDNNGDKKYDVIAVIEFETYVADGVQEDNEVISLKFNEASIKLEDNFYSVYKDGAKAALADIGIGDVLLVAASEPAARDRVYRIEVSTQFAMGSIQKTFSNDEGDFVTVGGKDYLIGEYCRKLIRSGYQSEISAGQAGRLFLDARGNIVYADLNSMVQNAGYLVDTAFIDNVFSSSMKLRVYTVDGKIEEFTTNDKLSVNGSNMEVSKIVSDVTLADKFSKPGLVEYSANDGIIRRIDFPEDAYNMQNFSKDASGSFKCTSTSILDYKYNVTASTVVFRVPKVSERSESYNTIMNDTLYYRIASGTYFGRGNWYNNTKLYDVGTSCDVRYVVIEYSPDASEIWEYNPILAVSEVGDGIDENGEFIKLITGLDENGNQVTLTTDENAEKAVYDNGLKREIKTGDVIQYRTDANGNLAEVKVQHSVDEKEYYTPVALESAKTNFTVFKSFGEVISGGSTRLLLACKEVWDGMSPLDTDVFVSNTGKAVYCFDTSKKKLIPIGFDEIERGDKVLVCMNDSNYARMIVIYD